MTAPTPIARAICCPSGRCIAPEACYALDRSRAYPVRINEAAEAVERIVKERLVQVFAERIK